MDKNLRAVLVFTMIYGLFSLGMLSLQPHAFDTDPGNFAQVAFAAE